MPYPWVKLSPQQIPLRDLNGTALKIFLYLGSLIDTDGLVTIPIQCIASFFGLSKRHIIRLMHELISSNLLEKVSEENAVLRVRVLKGIKVGAHSPGEDRMSVRDAVVWGNLAPWTRKSGDKNVSR